MKKEYLVPETLIMSHEPIMPFASSRRPGYAIDNHEADDDNIIDIEEEEEDDDNFLDLD